MVSDKTKKMILAEGFIRLPEIIKQIPTSKSSLWGGLKNGRYPSPVRIGERTAAWTGISIESLICQLTNGAIK